jgi:L-asparagine transporter-like permease
MYVTSRVLFVLSEKGDAPRPLVVLNKRKVPVRSILFASLTALLAIAASIFSPQVVFSFLVNASGATMLIIYLLVCMAQLQMRSRTGADAAKEPVVRMWLHPYGSYLTAAGIVVVLVAMGFSSAHRTELFESLGVLGIFLALSFLRSRAGQQKVGEAGIEAAP